MAARRRSSSSISFLASPGSPRRSSPRSNSSGCSRIHLMSCMAGSRKESRRGYSSEAANALDQPGPSLRRIGLRLARSTGLSRRAFFFNQLHRPDRALVEQQERDRERELAEHVGRRQDGGDHEGADDEIAT